MENDCPIISGVQLRQVFNWKHAVITKLTSIWFSCFIFLPMASAQSVTIAFDFNHSDGVAAGNGSGLLHSITANDPPDRFVDPLRLNFWRGANLLDDGLYHRLKRTNATIQYVLSDIFHDEDNDPWPHQNPGAWQKHVESTARKVIDKQWDVVWEPWNQPDYWPGEGLSDDEKFNQYLDAFLVAYRTIKALDTHARFSGPSVSAQHWPTARRQIEKFLDFCKHHNLEVTDLTWHGFDDRHIYEYPQRIKEIRQLASRSYSKVKVEKILISEIISEPYFTSPGDLIATLKYLEDAGVDGVGRSCWSEVSCWHPTLDGALVKDTDGSYHLTPLWWANYWAASLVGQGFSGVTSHPGIAASAAIKLRKLSILLGFSAAAGPKSSQNILLKFRGLKSVDNTSARVYRVSDLRGNVLPTPITVDKFELGERSGYGYLQLHNVQVGDAYLVEID